MLDGFPLRVDQVEVSMFSKYVFSYFLSEIHWRASIITFLGLVFISLEIYFSRFLWEGGLFSGLIIG